jgi:hypothetical protein
MLCHLRARRLRAHWHGALVMSVEIEIRRTNGGVQQRELAPGKYVIGREAGDIVLSDPGVSTRHAALTVTEGGVTLTDLGSTNGTFVGANRLTAPHLLLADQPVRLGGASITLRAAGSAVAPAPTAAPAAASQRRLLRLLAAAAGLVLIGLLVPRFLGGASSSGAGSSREPLVVLAGFHLGMSPEAATDACDGTVDYSHEALVAVQVQPSEPLRWTAEGQPIANPNGPRELPEPPVPDMGRNVEDIEPPAGRYLRSMVCNAKSGDARGRSEITFTRPPASLVTFVRHEPAPDDEPRDVSEHERALTERYGPPLSHANQRDSLDRPSRLLRWQFSPADDCEPRSPDPACWQQQLTVTLVPGENLVKIRQSLLEPTSDQGEREKFDRFGPR